MSRPRKLRNMLSFFRGLGSSDEYKPIQEDSNCPPDHGTISKFQDSRDSKSLTYDGRIDEEALPRGMSNLRKLSFVVSFSPCVLYFAVLLYFIPCRQPECGVQKEWIADVSGAMTSNLEVVKTSGVPNSILFGTSDEYGGSLVSLAISSGKLNWNRSSEYTFKHVFCDFDESLILNNVPGCIVTAYNVIAAVSSSNGKLYWSTNITQPDDVAIIHKVYLTKTPSKNLLILGLSDAHLFVLDGKSGVLKSTTVLPCSWTLNKKLSGPWVTKNGTRWMLMCDYGDSVELWTFLENDVLSSSTYTNVKKENNFHLYFSRSNSFGSMAEPGDVTIIRESDLVLSWAKFVVMATLQAPLRKTWEHSFDGPVTSALLGHFTESLEEQLAVTVRNGNRSSVLHILDLAKGSSVHITHLNTMNVKSMEKVSGLDNQTDVIVIESINPTSSEVSTNSSQSAPKSYFSIQYNGSSFIYHHLISDDVYASTLSSFHDGFANLISSSKDHTGHFSVHRTMVTNLIDFKKPCPLQDIANASTVFLLD